MPAKSWRHGGFEVAALGDFFAGLRVGVDAGDDDAFALAAGGLDGLQGAERRLVPGGPHGA